MNTIITHIVSVTDKDSLKCLKKSFVNDVLLHSFKYLWYKSKNLFLFNLKNKIINIWTRQFIKYLFKAILAILIISCGQNSKTSDTDNEENDDTDIKLFEGGYNKLLKQYSNDNEQKIPSNIKTLLQNPKNINTYKKGLAKLYNHEMETLPLMKSPRSEKEKTQLVNRAINFKVIKDMLSNLGYKFDKIKNKSIKQLLRDYEILGTAGIGPSLSNESPKNIQDHNFTLINSNEKNNDKKDWITNFNNVTKAFLKQAKIWESHNVIREYKPINTIPVLSRCENYNSEKYSKFNNHFAGCVSFSVPISTLLSDAKIDKNKLATTHFTKSISDDNGPHYKILQIDAKTSNIANSKVQIIDSAIMTYNKICKKNFTVRSIYHKSKLYIIILENKGTYNLIPNKNKLLIETVSRFELLNNISNTEYNILKRLGLINTKNIFEINIPKSLKVIKPFSWLIKNETIMDGLIIQAPSKKNVKATFETLDFSEENISVEKRYKKGDILDRTLAYSIAETALCILQELFPKETITYGFITKAPPIKNNQKIVPSTSTFPIQNASQSSKVFNNTKINKNPKILLTPEIISKIMSNIEKNIKNKNTDSNNLLFYKTLIRSISSLVTKIDGNHKSQDYDSFFNSTLTPDNKIASKKPLTLKTYGDLWNFFGCFYNSPNEIIEDLLKFKINK